MNKKNCLLVTLTTIIVEIINCVLLYIIATAEDWSLAGLIILGLVFIFVPFVAYNIILPRFSCNLKKSDKVVSIIITAVISVAFVFIDEALVPYLPFTDENFNAWIAMPIYCLSAPLNFINIIISCILPRTKK